ncbi:M56 family metallopeptidase [Mucilaginibacter flavus]|uniref:M56 family metallopeptidase n=1 Tax=Mucilaginibacter flavus TaxID=931504 RepID=UPI0025B515A3|nr:M56 family metallopeptidase [Mucilaginibacter flavus]MDN3579874.1 M56 family metallopeptidase [Mucilaginibacter flavus]
MNWLHYLLEANIYLAVFYACYCLFLNKETYYTLNRVYLLLSCIISFILPVMQVGALKYRLPLASPMISHAINTVTGVTTPVTVNQPISVYAFTWTDALWFIYIVGVAICSLLLIIKLFKVIRLITSTQTLIDNKYKLISIENTDAAFSFFNYLFIGTKTTGSQIIINHELVHMRQKHSFDVLFMELLKIVNWFNPVIYLIQVSLKTQHEYLADEQTARDTDALTYSSFLVDNAYGIDSLSVTHSFFNYNLLKKRIIMLNKKPSGNLAKLKYLLAAPIFIAMLCASTLAFSKSYAFIDVTAKWHKTTNYQLTFEQFGLYFNDNLGYPQKALKENTPGNVNCVIDIKDQRISNIRVTNSTGQIFSNQVINCLKRYNKNIPTKPGSYALYIQFVVQGPKTFYANEQRIQKEAYPCITNLTQLGYSTTLKAGKQNLAL